MELPIKDNLCSGYPQQRLQENSRKKYMRHEGVVLRMKRALILKGIEIDFGFYSNEKAWKLWHLVHKMQGFWQQ